MTPVVSKAPRAYPRDSRGNRPHHQASATVLLSSLLLAGCGTTIPGASLSSSTAAGLRDSRANTASPTAEGLPGNPGPPSGVAGQQFVSTTTGARTSSSTQNPTTAGPSSSMPATHQPAAGASTLAPSGFGWDSRHVYIGVVTQDDAQDVYSHAGASGVDHGDTRAQAQAIAADINKRGGILGRQVVPRFYDVPTVQTAENPDQAGGQTCTYFTQDAPVIAVFSMVTVMDVQSWRSCLASKHVPLFSGALGALDSTDARALAPYFYQMSMIPWNTLAPVLIRQLLAQHFFTAWNTMSSRPGTAKVRIGVLVPDVLSGTRQAEDLKKALAAAGYTDALTYAYPLPGNNIDGAVLYFKGNGVTHVISTDIELLTFERHAAAQEYFPRYGISTYNAPLNNLQGFGSAGENAGAVGIGWAPMLDVDDQHDPGPTGAGQRHCQAVMSGSGQGVTGKRLAAAFAFTMCDSFNLIAQGATGARSFAGPQLYASIDRIAAHFSAALPFTTGLWKGRFFSPGSVRDLAWSSACSCFQYTGQISAF